MLMVSLPPVSELQDLIDSGRVLDAWELSRKTDVPLEHWTKGEALGTAAKLTQYLGSSRKGRAMRWLNWRHDRKNPRWFYNALFSRADFTPGYNLLVEIENMLSANPQMESEPKADLLAFSAKIHAGYRDFSNAFDHIARALDLQPEDSWLRAQHSAVLEAADRYDEALTAAREAIRLNPFYHIAVIQCADILVHLGQDDEAIRILSEADRATQHAAFPMRLQVLHSEREEHKEGLECMDRIETRSPLMEARLKSWIAFRRADFHFRAGNMEECLTCCDSDDAYHLKRLAESLRKPGALTKRRVRLDVPFVRQHRMTCAPATLAALASFWNKPHEHLSIADAICHEGTPWHKERKWAEQHGFVAREFRLDSEALASLIDRGIPFTLTTEATTSAHLQACIGYDDRTGHVILRDPTERHFGEVRMDELMENHPIGGPRAMTLVPQEEVERLDGLLLPDEAAYESFHHLLMAMDGHDRWEIEAAASTLRAVAPDHPLAFLGTAMAASWNDDKPRQLAALEQILNHAPRHSQSILRKAAVLRNLGRWQEHRELLEGEVQHKGVDPVFFSELGELLIGDARMLPIAEMHLRKALKLNRYEARCFESYARLKSKQQKHPEAMRLRRIASCLAPEFEPYAIAYLESCRAAGLPAVGIAFLTERVDRLGSKSSGPWLTLASSLQDFRRSQEAADLLQRAVAARPDDGTLKLRGGSMMVGWGESFRKEGLQWMESARGTVQETNWLLEMAVTYAFLGNREMAIRCWQDLVRIQPWSIDAWRGLARLTAEKGGHEAAISLLDAATRQHPMLIPLWCLKAEWQSNTKQGPLQTLNHILEVDPHQLWARRERAICLASSGDIMAAEKDAREALKTDPWCAESHGVLGSVLWKGQSKPEALECMRSALRLSVDYTFAAQQLISMCADRDAEIEAIGFIESEMRKQVSDGTIVPVYQNLAWGYLDPAELLAQLKGFCTERPDLWQTWAALAEHAMRMRLDDEALEAADQLTRMFPLLARAWLVLGKVHQAASRHEEELQATSRAIELSPGWDEAVRSHALVLELLGRPDEALQALKLACELEPLSGPNHGCHAETLRRNGMNHEALSSIRAALELCPFYGWGWQLAAQWSVEDGCKDLLEKDLLEGGRKHGHNRSWWQLAASTWEILGEREQALDAVDAGLAMDPTDADLRDNKAYLLWASGRFDEAFEACAKVEGEEVVPVSIRGRKAWLLMHSGQPIEGVEEMRQLLEEEPGYEWAMAELAAWHENRGEWQELRSLSVRWLRTAPKNSRVLGYLGIAEISLGNKQAAKEAFARARSIDPEYIFAYRQLFDLQLEDKEFKGAAATLAQMEYYSRSPYIIVDGIRLELRKKDLHSAFDRAAQLLHMPSATSDIFGWVAEQFRKENHHDEWKSVDRQRSPPCSRSAGGLS